MCIRDRFYSMFTDRIIVLCRHGSRGRSRRLSASTKMTSIRRSQICTDEKLDPVLTSRHCARAFVLVFTRARQPLFLRSSAWKGIFVVHDCFRRVNFWIVRRKWCCCCKCLRVDYWRQRRSRRWGHKGGLLIFVRRHHDGNILSSVWNWKSWSDLFCLLISI